jgi:SAM-dependent methyltransferase
MSDIVPCPVCGSRELAPHSMRVRPGFPHISRVCCSGCGAIVANPMATDAELAEFYRGYYDKGNFGNDDAKASMDRFIRDMQHGAAGDRARELDRFKAYYGIEQGPGTRFLDVGCGLGRSLYLASLLGCSVSGTEMDADAVAFCQARLPNADVRQGDLLQQRFPADHFDFILLYHVIEHLRDPVSYLREIHRILKPGGTVCVGTPNPDALAYHMHRFSMFLRGRIPSIVDGLEHTVLFPRRTLRDAVSSIGFRVVLSRSEGHTESFHTIFRTERSLKRRVVRVVQKVARVNQVLIGIKE